MIREVKEEVNLNGVVQRLLFEDEYEFRSVYCFLVNEPGRSAFVLSDNSASTPFLPISAIL
ncbi:hypothetical protein [Paenibacillus sp. OV219]|uniref:hypothetical protein n=1 Tax=Paenibacillus sp. OV219 TaxID=1884377 RepID=UPI003526EFA8